MVGCKEVSKHFRDISKEKELFGAKGGKLSAGGHFLEQVGLDGVCLCGETVIMVLMVEGCHGRQFSNTSCVPGSLHMLNHSTRGNPTGKESYYFCPHFKMRKLKYREVK